MYARSQSGQLLWQVLLTWSTNPSYIPANTNLYTLIYLDYLDQQSEIQGQHPGVKVHNNDFIGAASYNIFAGISVAFIFGGAFFFDLFWPERHEDRGVKWAWKICAVAECLVMLGSALTMTVWHAVMLITRISWTDN